MNTLRLKYQKNERTVKVSGATKQYRNFYEFVIDGVPLSTRLDKFHRNKSPLLENLIGMLGSFSSDSDNFKSKQLLKKSISDAEIRQFFPNFLSKSEIENGVISMRAEFDNENVIIYGCSECGDYECGGYGVKILKLDDSFRWLFDNNGEAIHFDFDKMDYYKVFDKFVNYYR